MVYNTTDNRSSLSITDLTSDGEYLVTVAGRDGAGRLRQESEELVISKGNVLVLMCRITSTFLTVPQIVLLGYDHYPNSVQLKWKVYLH